MRHNYINIPELLRNKPNWVVWGIENAPPKAPYNPINLLSGVPSPAKAGVPVTWGNYNDAVKCVDYGLAQGIGYEFEGNDLYGIDLDNVMDKHCALTSEAYNIVGNLNSYTEISPGGRGLHIIVFAPGAEITRHRKKDSFLEIYNTGRYFTVTGNTYGAVRTIENRTKELQSIHDRFFKTCPVSRVVGSQSTMPITESPGDKFLAIGLERDKIFADLWNGQRRHGNESADDIALMNKLAYWCSGDCDAMVRAFISSPYHSQKSEDHIKKCKRTDYLPRTALNSCATAYSTAAADYERYYGRSKRQTNYVR